MEFLLGMGNLYAAVDAGVLGEILDPIIRNVVYPIIQFLFGLTVLIFIYGALQFVISDDESAREKGKATIKWGTFGIFIMVSAWGIIYLVSNTIKDIL